MSEKTKPVLNKMKQYYQNHKDVILLGVKILRDEQLRTQIQMALAEKGMAVYKQKVLYEEALDYASK